MGFGLVEMLVFTRVAVRGQAQNHNLFAQNGPLIGRNAGFYTGSRAGPGGRAGRGAKSCARKPFKKYHAGFCNLFGQNGRLIGRMLGFDTEIQSSAAKTQPVRAK